MSRPSRSVRSTADVLARVTLVCAALAVAMLALVAAHDAGWHECRAFVEHSSSAR